VLQACRKIAPGKTLTYAELADKVGSPGAARAVGNCMARNRFPLIIPCHRVVGSNGHLGGYSAAEGIPFKKRLLELEAMARATK
jgi:methylated-DNA-[protein]-cysteine S-methyltransferase